MDVTWIPTFNVKSESSLKNGKPSECDGPDPVSGKALEFSTLVVEENSTSKSYHCLSDDDKYFLIEQMGTAYEAKLNQQAWLNPEHVKKCVEAVKKAMDLVCSATIEQNTGFSRGFGGHKRGWYQIATSIWVIFLRLIEYLPNFTNREIETNEKGEPKMYRVKNMHIINNHLVSAIKRLARGQNAYMPPEMGFRTSKDVMHSVLRVIKYYVQLGSETEQGDMDNFFTVLCIPASHFRLDVDLIFGKKLAINHEKARKDWVIYWNHDQFRYQWSPCNLPTGKWKGGLAGIKAGLHRHRNVLRWKRCVEIVKTHMSQPGLRHPMVRKLMVASRHTANAP